MKSPLSIREGAIREGGPFPLSYPLVIAMHFFLPTGILPAQKPASDIGPLPLAAGEVQRDINYWNDGPGEESAHTLDIFPANTGNNRPVLIFVHGGAWKIGNKDHVYEKPQGLNREGIDFVSVNYRLYPEGTFKDQAADVAHAIAWVHVHAPDFGADPDKVFLMGHSAGAHLAALVSIDDRFLKDVGLAPNVLRGVILLDGAGYDIPQQIKGAKFRRARSMYESVFSDDPETQRDASPLHHVAADRGIPPFLMFHVQHRWDSKIQAEQLAEKLQGVGVSATVVAAKDKTHATINREFGQADDVVTAKTLAFLNECLQPEMGGPPPSAPSDLPQQK